MSEESVPTPERPVGPTPPRPTPRSDAIAKLYIKEILAEAPIAQTRHRFSSEPPENREGVVWDWARQVDAKERRREKVRLRLPIRQA